VAEKGSSKVCNNANIHTPQYALRVSEMTKVPTKSHAISTRKTHVILSHYLSGKTRIDKWNSSCSKHDETLETIAMISVIFLTY